MEWEEVVEHPSLRDLPFKIEMNAEGYIMMAPAKNKHRGYQARIMGWLQRLAQGKGAVSGCNIMTSDGELQRSELFEQFPAKIVLDFL